MRLQRLGVEAGDTVLLHSSFSFFSGFRGSPGELIEVFLRAVGRDGNLMMVSLPYLSSSFEYLRTLKYFDVRRTISRMGLVSETFRRQKNVVRSLHPTHPILARGSKAEWIVANHEDCLYPCGPGTPFDKLTQLEGKACFFDTPFDAFTFFHYLEDMVRDRLPFSLYVNEPFDVAVIDSAGKPRTVKTFVFSPEAIQRRRFPVLERELRLRKLIKSSRIGNTRLHLIEVNQAVACTRKMAELGVFFYRIP
ncbi:MAG: AAC(3) family N-acetyltransferase [Acidobacteria bacterium]|nr:AAC(3) family N-acetyltransferase [Acidobacteriota bacterium]